MLILAFLVFFFSLKLRSMGVIGSLRAILKIHYGIFKVIHHGLFNQVELSIEVLSQRGLKVTKGYD